MLKLHSLIMSRFSTKKLHNRCRRRVYERKAYITCMLNSTILMSILKLKIVLVIRWLYEFFLSYNFFPYGSSHLRKYSKAHEKFPFTQNQHHIFLRETQTELLTYYYASTLKLVLKACCSFLATVSRSLSWAHFLLGVQKQRNTLNWFESQSPGRNP